MSQGRALHLLERAKVLAIHELGVIIAHRT